MPADRSRSYFPAPSSGAATTALAPDPEIISSVTGWWGLGNQLKAYNAAIPVMVTNGAVNLALAVPFVVHGNYVVKRLWWLNGSAVAGNVDVGVYNSSFVRLISTGATAQAGVDTLQSVDVADTTIAAGQYFMAISASNTVTARFGGRAGGSVARLQAAGCSIMAAGHPLPDPFVPEAVSSQSDVIIFGVTNRTAI